MAAATAAAAAAAVAVAAVAAVAAGDPFPPAGEDHRRAVDAQFGRTAGLYALSEHKGGRDLDLMVAFARLTGAERVLDVATGAGHVAALFAPLAREVVATDLTAAMLAQAKALMEAAGRANVRLQIADAQALHLPDASFDVVTCRIAPHHFTDVDAATREVARVLRPGGRYVMEDSLAPDDLACAAFLHEAEVARDPTHVRSLTLEEWCAVIRRAGLRMEALQVERKRRHFGAWLERGGVAGAAATRIEGLFVEAPPRVRAEFEIEMQDARVTFYSDDKVVLAARR